ncbi:bifunctional D-glycero-beta-D-manno-heptose-7-phosphate kinase/D-glycero-beta-D-manno-heptose 1-phosphate adenylyltransferase HldE [Alloacidobacterium sp.]|uniref:bifunctional D-glycero-beta-D-manno-heptose-7-phosphate kinase/D-glycero-beta-D-manno-heptose 1-phosphate adenylyltransferase HldE n=1 Tax=Alloacidobacterium sp. TaxID=2951999 RepID=UPI002D306CC7|nr:bifunctional D-glycero-beta-D-manno-heptose-7-phosphate kinase/D-glycero-beta-D-manno-heptose 1-phosphate adenylyltransferase HldE [Alloacidobacterium sp.]HYK34987.1 bifunctional D-glycero-beta-D-manno-heptose-7-phosphate kinase/D-glycero-beta-D-manno-heptose 1-phosphate adenylyltransferase HldE [Alloacidobacterium sp.]
MIEDLHRVVRLIEGDWKNKHVLVVGDVMLDRYIWGDVKRISPEAPVPVVRAAHRSDQAGGAANVAANIAGLGAASTLIGFIGMDEDGQRLRKCLAEAGVAERFIDVASHPTTSKLRILGGNQQILRLDVETTSTFVEEAYLQLQQKVADVLPEIDAIILSDYAKGVLTKTVCRSIITMARKARVPVLVDPKQKKFECYRGATMICPNLHELSAATGMSDESVEHVLAAGQGLVPELELDYLTVTLSEKGIAVLRKDRKETYPAVARQVFDVSGAGDTVIATLTLSLASGLEIGTAVQLANIAAGVVVSKVGTVPVTSNDLLASLMPEIELNTDEKVVDLNQLKRRISAWRSRGEKIVFTNGCFDLLHIGHISLLQQARREGDRLIVAINSDESVSCLKGPTRPIVSERERAYVLAALGVVNAVVIFGESTPLDLIKELHPDVIVKGGDYTEDKVVGAQEVRSWGGRVKIVPTVEGFSTSKLIERATAPTG